MTTILTRRSRRPIASRVSACRNSICFREILPAICVDFDEPADFCHCEIETSLFPYLTETVARPKQFCGCSVPTAFSARRGNGLQLCFLLKEREWWLRRNMPLITPRIWLIARNHADCAATESRNPSCDNDHCVDSPGVDFDILALRPFLLRSCRIGEIDRIGHFGCAGAPGYAHSPWGGAGVCGD